MMNQLTTISLEALTTVTGGAEAAQPAATIWDGAGKNRTSVSGDLSVQTPAVTVKGQGQYDSASTNYNQCLQRNASATPQALTQACGLPPAD